MKELRLGLMSPGTWGKNIIKSCQKSGAVEIVACASRRYETALKASEEFGITAAKSYEELLKMDIDGVIIASCHDEHYARTLEAAKAGKHVLIEKPIANTIQEAKLMAQACDDANVVLSVGHSQRRLPGPRTLKRLFESGEYGSVVNALAYVGLQGIDMYGLGHWLLDGKKNPGGSLYMMGVHFIETFQYLMGPIEKATGFTVTGMKGTTIPEAASGVFAFKNKSLGYLGSHYIAPYNSTASFYCEKAIFHMEKFGRELYIQDSPFPTIERRTFPLDPNPYNDPVYEELEEFAMCIETGKKPETGAAEAILALAGIRALMISSQEQRTLTLEEIIERY
ncbi:MAG: Gfo/Idh/MocA family oxidoreductase [Sphaerochaetaceae bacterium]|nr:Gfo/Idh/MocA family oxidoreductase [Sphaerochaetaceae bacterium]MDD4259693.1 Gfo/Idh/MocA family oxidoreductase [Sphaerochaetaceae bacterium]MDD4842423.1 Gfo/Idh/MocA family oxidoreductase [Sphaerochaetaceae bacterium]NLO61534.1 Gfo/Idh/MocA family oxidoreductase [Spirochaetales bacterium]